MVAWWQEEEEEEAAAGWSHCIDIQEAERDE